MFSFNNKKKPFGLIAFLWNEIKTDILKHTRGWRAGSAALAEDQRCVPSTGSDGL